MVRIIDFIQRNVRFFILLTAVLLVNIVGFLLGSYREYRLYHDSEQVLAETGTQLRKAEREQDRAAGISDNVRDVRQWMTQFFDADLRPGGEALPDLTRQLYDILTRNRMAFQHVTYSRKAELNGRLVRVVVHVPVKASYDDLRKLLTDLEELPFPTMVDRVSVSSAMGREVNATIDIVSYFREQ